MPFAELERGRIWYEHRGTIENVVVLAGGSGMPPVVWDLCGVTWALLADGFSVLTYAASGVRPSERPAPQSVDDLSGELSALLDHLGITECQIVGYSLGGFVAEHLALGRPDAVRAIVLLASAGPTSPLLGALLETAEALLESLGHLPEAFCRWEELVTALDPTALVDERKVAEWWELSAAHEEIWASTEAKTGQWQAAARWLADESRMSNLAELSMPVLVAAYEYDLLFPPARARLALDRLPDGSYAEIEGAAHGGLVTHPEQTVEVLRTFLRPFSAR